MLVLHFNNIKNISSRCNVHDEMEFLSCLPDDPEHSPIDNNQGELR